MEKEREKKTFPKGLDAQRNIKTDTKTILEIHPKDVVE